MLPLFHESIEDVAFFSQIDRNVVLSSFGYREKVVKARFWREIFGGRTVSTVSNIVLYRFPSSRKPVPPL